MWVKLRIKLTYVLYSTFANFLEKNLLNPGFNSPFHLRDRLLNNASFFVIPVLRQFQMQSYPFWDPKLISITFKKHLLGMSKLTKLILNVQGRPSGPKSTSHFRAWRLFVTGLPKFVPTFGRGKKKQHQCHGTGGTG